MARNWSKITWEELEQDRNYNIYIDGVLEGRIFKVDHTKWKFEIYFDAYDLGPWGTKIHAPELSKIYHDRSDARTDLVRLWEKYKPEIEEDLDIGIEEVEEDTDPDIGYNLYNHLFPNTP